MHQPLYVINMKDACNRCPIDLQHADSWEPLQECTLVQGTPLDSGLRPTGLKYALQKAKYEQQCTNHNPCPPGA
jgi:hypothetical protein